MTALFTCSVDDGHPADLMMAELLGRHGLRATFYVPFTNSEGLPVMSAAQLRGLGPHIEIASHTLDHCFLTRVDKAQAAYQIVAGKAALEQQLGRAVTGFCYPGGQYQSCHIAQVRTAGFAYARTTMNLCLDAGPSRFEMATTCQFYPHQRGVYLRNFIRGGYWGARGASLARALQQRDWIARQYALFDHANGRGGVFHLWAHSIDVERLAAWPALDQFLAYVAQCVPPDRRLDNGALAERCFGPN